MSALVSMLALVMSLADPDAMFEAPLCQPAPRYDAPGKRRPGRPRVRAAAYRHKRQDQVREQFGTPTCGGPTQWRYFYPHGCEWRTVVTLWFVDRKVNRVNVVEEYTPERCSRKPGKCTDPDSSSL